MKLKEAPIEGVLKDVALGNLKGGEVFRFAHIPFYDAMKEDAFYMVLDPHDHGKVLIANIADGLLLKRDTEHRVMTHLATLSVSA